MNGGSANSPYWAAIVIAVVTAVQTIGAAYFNHKTQEVVNERGTRTVELVERKLDADAEVVKRRLEESAARTSKSLEATEKRLKEEVKDVKETLSLGAK